MRSFSTSLLSVSAVGDVISLVFSLLGVIAILVLAYYATRMFARSHGAGNPNSLVKIVDRVALAQDKFFVIIEVAGQYMLVGVTAGSMSKICDLTPEQVQQSTAEKGAGTSMFSGALERSIESFMSKTNKTGSAEEKDKQ